MSIEPEEIPAILHTHTAQLLEDLRNAFGDLIPPDQADCLVAEVMRSAHRNVQLLEDSALQQTVWIAEQVRQRGLEYVLSQPRPPAFSSESEQLLTSLLHLHHQEAFELLIPYGPRLERFIAAKYPLFSREERDDIVQDTFLRAYDKGPEFDPKVSKLPTWLTMQANYRALDDLRLHISPRDINHFANTLEDKRQQTPESASEQASPQMLEFIQKLSPQRAKTVIMHYFEGMSFEAIARALNTSEVTVRTNLSRARKDLQRLMGDNIDLVRRIVPVILALMVFTMSIASLFAPSKAEAPGTYISLLSIVRKGGESSAQTENPQVIIPNQQRDEIARIVLPPRATLSLTMAASPTFSPTRTPTSSPTMLPGATHVMATAVPMQQNTTVLSIQQPTTARATASATTVPSTTRTPSPNSTAISPRVAGTMLTETPSEPSGSLINDASATPTASVMPEATSSPTSEPSATLEATSSSTSEPSATPQAATSSPTVTPSSTATPTLPVSATPEATSSPTREPSATAESNATLESTINPTLTPTATVIVPDACTVYGVHDGGDGATQLVVIDPVARTVHANVPEWTHGDIRDIALRPGTNEFYAVSGDEGSRLGALFRGNLATGELTYVGSTGFRVVSAIAFNPIDGTLWGWIEDKGLVRINTDNGSITSIYETSVEIDGLAWNSDGTRLYGAAQTDLWVYADGSLEFEADNLPGITQAIGFNNSGKLVGTFHENSAFRLYTYNLDTHQAEDQVRIVSEYEDIDALAWPASCSLLEP